MSVEEYFETGPDFERPIFEAVLSCMQRVDPDIWYEPVSVGIFFKRRTVFLSLRTMSKWTAVCFQLDRQIESPRISRKVISNGGRYYHVVNVSAAEQIDDELKDWLLEAFDLDA